MKIILTFVIFYLFVLVICITTFCLLNINNRNKNKSKQIIQHFQLSDGSPTLSEMINFHEGNDIIQYEIEGD